MRYSDFEKELIGCGWQFVPAGGTNPKHISDAASGRLERAGGDVVDFAMSFNILASQQDDVWFVSFSSYMGVDETDGFAWNEFETESLKSARDENQADAIRIFWAIHLPFMVSVKSGYAYLAIVLEGHNKGCIVSGREPEYEEATVVASSLEYFFDKFVAVIKGEVKSPDLEILI